MTNRSQAVRLPKEFQFSTDEVFIRKQGEEGDPVTSANGLGDRIQRIFIAAHARSLGLRFVTNNTAKFGRVKGLTVENWKLPRRRSRSTIDE